jgi:hypothetical protein
MPIREQPVEPAAVICAILAPAATELAAAGARIESQLGTIERHSAPYPFDFSSYYRNEMGPGLLKQLLWLTDPVDPSKLYTIKRQTMEIEKALAERKDGEYFRRANIDPGLVTVESLVLATTKYSGHRICIGPGLFAETTLLFQKGGCQPLPWTYPDFRTPLVQDFLLEIRNQLLQVRRSSADNADSGAFA